MNLKPEQLKAINHNKGNCLVSASAGSGKTFVMINRIVRLIVENKADVNEILAVTFTESAASDMKQKLIKELANAVIEHDDIKERLKENLNLVRASDISTLHSFCAKIIRTYFFVLGLQPDFKILDAEMAEELKEKAIVKVFNQYYKKRDKEFIKFSRRYQSKRTDDQLKLLIKKTYDSIKTIVNQDEYLKNTLFMHTEEGYNKVIGLFNQIVIKKIQEIYAFYKRCSLMLESLGIDNGLKLCTKIKEDLTEVLKNGSIYALKNLDVKQYRFSFSTKKDEKVQELRECAKYYKNLLVRIISNVAQNLTDPETDLKKTKDGYYHALTLVNVLKEFEKEYDSLKQDENALDFNDLERYTISALSNKEVQASVKEKYKYIFVDEYQDTNYVQEEILNLISNDNLFMVGDYKQSIYAFRGCRPEIFTDKLKRYESTKEGEIVLLNDNFRCAKNVIDKVNEIFSYSMTDEIFGLDYKKTSKLTEGGVYPEDCLGRVKVHAVPEKKREEKGFEEPKVYSVLSHVNGEKQYNFSEFTSIIKSIIDEEVNSTYYDFKEKTYKRVRYKDIAILFRSIKGKDARDLVSVLNKHNIQVSSEVEENIKDFPEIQFLICVLRYLDSSVLDIPLATLLKSPVGGLSDEDLLMIARFNDSEGDKYSSFYSAFSLYKERGTDLALKEKLEKFCKYMHSLKLLKEFLGAKEVLEKLLLDFNIISGYYATKGGSAKVNRINQFLSACVLGGKKLTVREVLKKVDSSSEFLKFSDVNGEDTVKVMTMHKSKGLEYPVVIVCDMDEKFNLSDLNKPIMSDKVLGLAPQSFDDKSKEISGNVFRGYIAEALADESLKEEMRLLYVALTRAKYSLHVICKEKYINSSSIFYDAERLVEFLPPNTEFYYHDQEKLKFISKTHEPRKVLISDSDKGLEEEFRKNLTFEYPYLASTTLPIKSSVTSSMKKESDEEVVYKIDFEGELSDTEKGIIAHKIMEHVDFEGEFDTEIERLISSGVISNDELKKIKLDGIKKAFDKIKVMVSGAINLKEKSFIVALPATKVFNIDSDEEVLIQGVIDLMSIKDGYVEIYDYKYSALSGKNLKEKYQKQLDLYAESVEKVLKLPVKNKVIVGLVSGEMS